MKTAQRHVLIIDDDRLLCKSAALALSDLPVRVRAAHSGADGLAICRDHPPDVVLLDQKLPDTNGNGLCQPILASCEGAKIIFITAYPSFENAVQALKLGAYDYLTKPFEAGELHLAISRAIHTLDLEKVAHLQQYQRKKESDRTTLVGADGGLREIQHMVELAAVHSAPVLITGETGTGKTLVAKKIHYRGGLSDQPFIGVNCAAIPDGLMEAEFFGHEKGAFTGAQSASKGLFEMADCGTLFLDEISEVPIHLQAKLLGVLDDQQIRRVGGQRIKSVTVRIIAATNADLPRAIARGGFREDLYYRLGVVHIHLPPLRERVGDIAELCRFFISKLTPDPDVRIGPRQIQAMQAYAWPGNVRELRNVLERAIIVRRGPGLQPARLLGLDGIQAASESSASQHPPKQNIETLSILERNHIRDALAHFSHNHTRTARALGISRSTLLRKLKSMASDS